MKRCARAAACCALVLAALAAAAPEAAPAAGSWWNPPAQVRWQIQYTGHVSTDLTDVDLYVLDLFDVKPAAVTQIHDQGRRLICSIDTGSIESWRPDARDFPSAAVGNAVDGWADEHWIDIRSADVRAVIRKRLDLAKTRQCDGISLANAAAYTAATGFPLTANDQLDYNGWLVDQAHARGLAAGMVDDLAQVAALAGRLDFGVAEGCVAAGTCGRLRPYLAQGKPVLHIEYADDPTKVCGSAARAGLSTILKKRSLDAWRVACPADGPVPTTTSTPRPTTTRPGTTTVPRSTTTVPRSTTTVPRSTTTVPRSTTSVPRSTTTVPIPPGGSWWKLPAKVRWQMQYTGTIDTNLPDVDIYVLDLWGTSAATVAQLHGQGKRLICYFSAGSYEDWRPDAKDFPAAALGNDYGGWPG
ncbi:MAG: hypothetical protein JWM05_2823, partial [Acidimicrobiales bacterium]|nr:hypothetical protein [Acidimicrobiales bacterium]